MDMPEMPGNAATDTTDTERRTEGAADRAEKETWDSDTDHGDSCAAGSCGDVGCGGDGERETQKESKSWRQIQRAIKPEPESQRANKP